MARVEMHHGKDKDICRKTGVELTITENVYHRFHMEEQMRFLDK